MDAWMMIFFSPYSEEQAERNTQKVKDYLNISFVHGLNQEHMPDDSDGFRF